MPDPESIPRKRIEELRNKHKADAPLAFDEDDNPIRWDCAGHEIESVAFPCDEFRALTLALAADEKDALWKDALDRLTKKQAEVDGYRAVLEGYERWEAALIMTADAWRGSLPVFTEGLYTEWMNLQTKRNAVLKPGAAGAIGGKPE